LRRWEDNELDGREQARELGRLVRRARRRRLLIVFISLCITLLTVVRGLRRQREYPATVVLVAIESNETLDNRVRSNQALHDYIAYAVFTESTLVALMNQHQYRMDQVEKNPRLRIESFRDRIDIDVFKNEFNEPRYTESPPRSARIAIEFRYQDPDKALEIARELGNLVILRDAENRRARMVGAERTAAEAVSYLEAHLNRVSRELEQARSDVDNDTGDRGDALVRLVGGERALAQAISQLRAATDRRNMLARASSADRASLELRYEQADWGAPKVLVNEVIALARASVATFFGMLFIVALVVAVFDPRVYEAEDVARLGLRPLGELKLDSRHS
jgi:hypothetical protein